MLSQPTPSYNPGVGAFVEYAKSLLVGGDALNALQVAEDRQYQDATRILKSAVEVGTTSDVDWAASLMPHRIAASAFVDGLRNVSIFEAMFASMRRVPLATQAAVVTAVATGDAVSEMSLKPVSKLSLASTTLEARKAIALIVLSSALARLQSAAADALLSRELRAAVAYATDSAFLSELAVGATSVVSSGSTAVDIYGDVAQLLASVPLGGDSKPFLILTAADMAQVAARSTTSGAAAFPGALPSGGTIAGIPALPSDAIPAQTMMLVDASQIAADSMTIMLSASSVATVQLDSAPDSSSDGIQTSLWQQNMVGLKAERIFGFQRLRDAAVAVLTGVSYGSQS